jgi:RNA polymerase sigma-70 factor (ECF subfamily)
LPGDDTDDGPSLDDFPADEPLPHESACRVETGDAVRCALAELPEAYRSVLVLRHYEDLKFREIADILGLPEGTVKTRMTEALNEMARLLRRRLDLNVALAPGRRARPPRFPS